MHENDLVYFNNSHGADHAEIYSMPDAFFDLSATRHANLVVGLPEGQECVVVEETDAQEMLTFGWYFLKEEIQTKDGIRIFTGQHIRSEKMTRSSARKHKVYKKFFNVNGHLKRASAAIQHIPLSHRATKQLKRNPLTPEEVDVSRGPYPEGATRTITVNAYERSAQARAVCKEHYGTRCTICGFSFKEAYGDVAAHYIHIHHLKPLAKIKKAYKVNPIKDMRPVCANCHAVIHLGGENRSPKVVKELLRGEPASWFADRPLE